VAAARSEIQAAIDLALATAARAATRLAELETAVQGDLAPLFIRHVQALVAGHGAAPDEVAASFAALGAHLLAAEASAAAAAGYRRADRAGRAVASAARAAALAAACVGARITALARRTSRPGLTPRELEIARMAASGLSSRAIAARLVVAVRMVDNAPGQVYAKPCIAQPGTEI
jgi:DNA-binding CsgD family transcriptional regulator